MKTNQGLLNKYSKHWKVIGRAICFAFIFVTLGALDAAAFGYRVIPEPKKMVVTEEQFLIQKTLPVRMNEDVQKMFVEEMEYLGQSVLVESYVDVGFRFLWGELEEMELSQSLLDMPIHPEGYFLKVTPSGVGIAAQDQAGLFHGIQTLLQLIEQSSEGIPCCTVTDWPDFTFRGFHTTLRQPSDFQLDSMEELMETYEWMIRRLARYKYTHVNLLLKGVMSFKCYPELSNGPWDAKSIRHLIRFANDRGINIFPEVKTLGKFFHKMPEDRMVTEFGHLLEPQLYIGQLDYQSKYHAGYKKRAEVLEEEQKALEKEKHAKAKISGDFQITNPQVLEFLKPILDEVYEVFNQPEFYNIGCDESYYTAINENQEDRGKIMAGHINSVADYLQEKGCKVVMWDDMLLSSEMFPYFFEAHGGPPLDTWKAVDFLDRDIIIASWHYGYTVAGHYPKTYPMIPWFVEKGFSVIGVPWYIKDSTINLAHEVAAVNGMGMLGSSWAIHMEVSKARRTLPAEQHKKAKRQELSVLAVTAEVAWSPETAAEVLTEYDPEAWEKKWLK